MYMYIYIYIYIYKYYKPSYIYCLLHNFCNAHPV